MSDIFDNLEDIKAKHDVIVTQKVARFSYTDQAYTDDDANGVAVYDFANEQNVPTKETTQVRTVVLDKGVRTQAASLPRDAINHFFGRVSYNLNKLNDWFNTVIADLLANFATNGNRYSSFAKYKQDDTCSFKYLDSIYFFRRHSAAPAEITGLPPMVNGVLQTTHWEYQDTGIGELRARGKGFADGSQILTRKVFNKTSKYTLGRAAQLCVSKWQGKHSAADNFWLSVCWSAELGLFCAVAITGAGNRVMTSPDGINWTTQASAADNDWFSVCWSSELGLFCAVALTGAGNRVMTSPDGITWTTRTSAADNNWRSVCWSAELGLFCAVAQTGAENRVMTSPDGITWTAQTSAAANGWISVCWSAELGLFCAVAISGVGNRVMTSPDGITWTTQASAADNLWRSVCWSAELGLFCAVASSGVGNRVMTSPDGVNWTTQASAADNGWFSVCWSAELGLFCAVARSGAGNRVMTSPDGITWTTQASAADNEWASVCWSAELGLFCAVAYTGAGNRVMTSTPLRVCL